MNRVDQIYEDESAIRMVLIGDNDKLNLDTAALANQAERPVRRGAVLHDGAVTVRRGCSTATAS